MGHGSRHSDVLPPASLFIVALATGKLLALRALRQEVEVEVDI